MKPDRWRAEQRRVREAVYLREKPAAGGATSLSSVEPAEILLVSVIVVCLNAEKVLPRCLEQLLDQDYPNYEIVVVDDGSTDNTAVVAKMASARGQIALFRCHRNRGCPHARNLGLREAKGDIVAFIDADGYAAPDWLASLVRTFGADAGIGGVASTVFFDFNPAVINGAGGVVNRQGWAADLSMNEPYERAEIAAEALYPMGCGMAIRRAAIERVGPFDESMLNYYDDTDYGIRLWRAGYRVAVSPGAWIDHGLDPVGGDSALKQLLCERHRMRVVLKHLPAEELGSWLRQEVLALKGAPSRIRTRKLRAAAWNVAHMPSVLASRRRLRSAAAPPTHLIDSSWGDAFPAGVQMLSIPRPEGAGSAIDVAKPASEDQLLHGWYPLERVDGRSYRWAGLQAAVLMRLDAPASCLRLDYAHVPVDIGGVDVRIRRVGSEDPLHVVWSARLDWRYVAHSVENRPLQLPAGDYEVLFSAREGWLEPPLQARRLSFALTGMSLEQSPAIASGGLDMGSPGVEEQLVSGWYEAERSPDRSYRWGGAHAEVLVRLHGPASGARLNYRLPPARVGEVVLTVSDPPGERPIFSARLPRREGGWLEDELPLALSAGDYLVCFDTDATWSNPGGSDASLWPENRSLGVALSSLAFLQDG